MRIKNAARIMDGFITPSVPTQKGAIWRLFAWEDSDSSETTPSGYELRYTAAYPRYLEATTSAGGPGGIRTHDLCVANAALSQLSYKPKQHIL